MAIAAFSVFVALIMIVQSLSAAESSRFEIETKAISTLTIGFLNGVDSLNPYLAINPAACLFLSLVYDSLFTMDQDLNYSPDLASSAWIVPVTDPALIESGEPYGSVWQYNLTQDAYWSDGVLFTADDVVWNINLNVGAYSELWAYQPYSYFISGAEKIDDFTVRVHFWDKATEKPMPVAWGKGIFIPMLPVHLMGDFPASYIGFNWGGVFSENISPGMPLVGTGPYMVTSSLYSEWLGGSNITLVKNPWYHARFDTRAKVGFDRINLKFYGDPATLTIDLRIGRVDVAKLPPVSFDSMKKNIDLGTSGYGNLAYFDSPDPTGSFDDYQFRMDVRGNPSANDPAIRQALHLATNKTYIVNNFYLGYADEGSTLVSPANKQWHYEPSASEKFVYNLSAAAALLTANGYVDIDSDGIRECTIGSPAVQHGYVSENAKLTYDLMSFREDPQGVSVAAYLKSQWALIGVGLNLSSGEYAFIAPMLHGDIIYPGYGYYFDQVLWWWTGDVDPSFILFPQTARAAGRWSDDGYSNPRFEENYTNSIQTLNNSMRRAFVDNCQRIFYSDSEYIILAYPHSTYVYNWLNFTGWGNWSAHPGRSLDAYWGTSPLFFELRQIPKPIVDGATSLIDLIIIAGIVIVCVVVSIYLLRMRRPGSDEKQGRP